MNLEGECVRLFIICQTQKRSIEFHRLDLQLVFTCYSKGVVNHGSGIVFISPFPEVFLKVQARNQSLSQLGKKGGGGRVGEVFTTVKSTSDSIRSAITSSTFHVWFPSVLPLLLNFSWKIRLVGPLNLIAPHYYRGW